MIRSTLLSARSFWLRLFCGFLGLSSLHTASPAAGVRPWPLAEWKAVVVDEKGVEVTKFAAQELADYIGRLRHQPIEVIDARRFDAAKHRPALFVGEGAASRCLKLELSPWKQEEWTLKSVPEGLVLAGADKEGAPLKMSTEAGSALAVYTLLDDYLGIKWIWPGKIGEHVPDGAQASIPIIDRREAPRFIIRQYGVGYGSYHTPSFKKDVDYWMRRTRQGWVQKAIFGHSWFYTFDLKNGSVFKKHPDWFALVKGERRPPQMCTTHPEVIKEVIKAALASPANIATISPSDGAGFCECTEETKSEAHRKAGIPACTSLDIPGRLAYDNKNPELSDRIFTYANTVARAVREKDPNKGVGIFAYTFYNKPPVKIDKLEPNLYLSFVSQAMSLRDPQAAKDWEQTIRDWHTKDARMILREGWGNHYLLDLPFMHYLQILHAMHFAEENGFVACYGEGSKTFANQGPNAWAVVRMLWDPAQDTGKVMAPYYEAAFGPAAQPMAKYYEFFQNTLDKNWPKRRFIVDSRTVTYANLVNSWHIILPFDEVLGVEKYLKEAEALVQPDSEYGARIAACRKGYDYAKIILELMDSYRRLSEMGLKMEFFSSALPENHQPLPLDQALLERAYELGERREDFLLSNRDLPIADEGLLAGANEHNIRMWHQEVKNWLKKDHPSRLSKKLLLGKADS